MGGHVLVLDRKLLSEKSGIELEKHGEEVLMRPEQFFPASDGLEYLGLHAGIDILGHE